MSTEAGSVISTRQQVRFFCQSFETIPNRVNACCKSSARSRDATANSILGYVLMPYTDPSQLTRALTNSARDDLSHSHTCAGNRFSLDGFPPRPYSVNHSFTGFVLRTPRGGLTQYVIRCWRTFRPGNRTRMVLTKSSTMTGSAFVNPGAEVV